MSEGFFRFATFAAMLIATTACLAHAQAIAAGPVAVIEDVSAPGVKLELFDFLDEGQTIDLGAKSILVVGYLASCIREVINGGRATIGGEQSNVTGGTVERELVECGGGNIRLTKEQAGKSGAQVFRNKGASESMHEAELRVFSLSPFLNVARLGSRAGNQLIIERLDRPDDPINVQFGAPQIDLAKSGVTLKRGGLYRASVGSESIVFRIDRFAADGPAPLLSRLIQF